MDLQLDLGRTEETKERRGRGDEEEHNCYREKHEKRQPPVEWVPFPTMPTKEAITEWLIGFYF